MTASLDTRAPSAPDRDWQALRDTALAALAVLAPAWTDHNLSDPGVTVAEAVAWGLADLHYRTEHAPLDGWSAEAGLGREPAERHWSGAPLPQDHGRLRALASALAALAPEVVATVRAAPTPAGAASAMLGAGVPADLTAAAARLLRTPSVLRAALDGAAAVEQVRGLDEPVALATLRVDPAFDRLWDDELRAVRRRARRRATAREARRRTGEPRVEATTSETWETPETFETADGWTTQWPPRPEQARTVEPVTADDSARLARAVPGVRRAWTVPEVLPGLGWDGAPVLERTRRLGAVTLLVEADPLPADEQGRTELLRRVLRAVGDEVDAPFAPLHTDVSAAGPRRTVCDEVGAALLQQCPITLRGVLHVATTSDRDDVRDDALGRVAALLASGRPESAGPVQEPAGWVPGEAVRVTELVQRLVDSREVYGVEALEARVEGGAWQAYELPLDPSCVPVLSQVQCLRVAFDLVEGCGGAC